AADNVLVETQNPRMNPVRALIAEEMIALRKAPSLDVQGAILRLQALQKELPSLPWIPNKFTAQNNGANQPDAAAADQEAPQLSWYMNLWNKVTTALTGLVRIRVH